MSARPLPAHLAAGSKIPRMTPAVSAKSSNTISSSSSDGGHVKSVSRSTSSGFGPKLTISNEADALIMGRSESSPPPPVPPISEAYRPKFKERRGLRDMFSSKRGEKPGPASAPKESKRASSLAQRLRRTNFSLANLKRISEASSPVASPRATSPVATAQDDAAAAAATAPEAPEPIPASAPTPTPEASAPTAPTNAPARATDPTLEEATAIMASLRDQLDALTPTSPDRLRGEHILTTFEVALKQYREATISVVEARYHHRNAELRAETFGRVMRRLIKLCGPVLGEEKCLGMAKCVLELEKFRKTGEFVKREDGTGEFVMRHGESSGQGSGQGPRQGPSQGPSQVPRGEENEEEIGIAI